MTYLSAQKILKISGEEAKSWLANLLTSDVANLAPGLFQPTALLTPQGKIIWSGLIGHCEDDYYLTVHQSVVSSLQSRMMMYKLRAKLDISVTELSVQHSATSTQDTLCFKDQRFDELGYLVLSEEAETGADTKTYDDIHYALGIMRQGIDFGEAEIFPHDIGLDKVGGVDFQKGCYVGQEVVSRMQHKGGARKRALIVRAEQALPDDAKGAQFLQNEKSIGTLTSSSGEMGLGLVRIDKWEADAPILLKSETVELDVQLTKPRWLSDTSA